MIIKQITIYLNPTNKMMVLQYFHGDTASNGEKLTANT